MTWRIAAAEISHETNVFSSVPTDLEAFHSAGLYLGDQIAPAKAGTNSAFGGFCETVPGAGMKLLPILSVWATPAGIVTREAFDWLIGTLLDGLNAANSDGGLDGVLLALHGAMVTEDDMDGDGHLLELVRENVGADVPVVATLDLHANISPRMVAATDLLIGYDTYPHVDMSARASEASLMMRRLLEVDFTPVTALVKPPMLPTSQNMTTDRDPMATLMVMAHMAEQRHDVVVTVAGGFPPSDVLEAGLSVMVTANKDAKLAQLIAEDIAAAAFEMRDQFLGGVSTFATAAEAIRQHAGKNKPLLVVDIGDNPWTGGPGDSVEIVRFLLANEVSNAAVALVKDPEAVAMCQTAGVGNRLTLTLGARTDKLHGQPMAVSGTVQGLFDGHYRNAGPMMAGLDVNLGPTAVLRVDGVDLLITSCAETPIDLNVFRAHGIEPTELSVIGLKGKGHFRAAFEMIASEVILVEGPGITGADLTRLPFRHITRPIWPLDDVEWNLDFSTS